MTNAEAAGTVAREQYGSRKNHRSIIAALNLEQTSDNGLDSNEEASWGLVVYGLQIML
jgi:hypothetical protein